MRQQQGYVFKSSGGWYLKYRQDVIESGTVRRKLCTYRLADVDDRCRTISDARKLAVTHLKPLNEGKISVGSTMPLSKFVEDTWLPHVKPEVRPATYYGYRQMWNLYLKPKFGSVPLCDIKPKHVAPYLDWLQREKGPRAARYSKTVACMIFNYAIRPLELLESNPFQGRMLKAQDRKQGYATTLNEFAVMLRTFKDQPQIRAVLGLAFFGGLRPSEMRGVKWEDYDRRTQQMLIHTSVWKKQITGSKTIESSALVPINEPLTELLAELWEHDGRPTEGWILRGEKGGPLSLDNLGRRIIRPTLKAVGITWVGYYALRRGAGTIATVAARDKGLAARGLLRHKTVTTTAQFYIGDVPEETRAAVQTVGQLFHNCYKELTAGETPPQVSNSFQRS